VSAEIAGVKGVYDRHSYIPEKAHALTELAALVERIVNPPAANVAELAPRGGGHAGLERIFPARALVPWCPRSPSMRYFRPAAIQSK
jgi:hypothetical protein